MAGKLSCDVTVCGVLVLRQDMLVVCLCRNLPPRLAGVDALGHAAAWGGDRGL